MDGRWCDDMAYCSRGRPCLRGWCGIDCMGDEASVRRLARGGSINGDKLVFLPSGGRIGRLGLAGQAEASMTSLILIGLVCALVIAVALWGDDDWWGNT